MTTGLLTGLTTGLLIGLPAGVPRRMTVDNVRESLRRRQFAVLGELLAGTAPAGFDPQGCLLTGRILAQRRVTAAVAVTPELLLLAAGHRQLTAFAMAVPPQSCAHADVDAFVRTVPVDEAWHQMHLVYTAGDGWPCWLSMGAGSCSSLPVQECGASAEIREWGERHEWRTDCGDRGCGADCWRVATGAG